MFQKFVDNYSSVQIFVMTSVTTAREQNTHKTLTIIILLRTLCMFYLPTFLFILHPSVQFFTTCHKSTPLSSLTAKYPYLSNSSKDCKIDRKPQPAPVTNTRWSLEAWPRQKRIILDPNRFEGSVIFVIL